MSALACFVSSHGYGHATRTSAVLAALNARRPEVALHVFTEVPAEVFDGAIPGGVALHREWTDVGLVQADPFREDLAATARALAARLPFRGAAVERLAAEVRATGARAVLCDISPLGIAVAQAAGLPSVLVENFTWHWIYRGYLAREPALGPIADALEQQFAAATVHVQAAPVCEPAPGALRVPPISRPPRASRAEVRARLGVSEQAPLVLLTLGGVPWSVSDEAAAALGRRAGGARLLVPARQDAARGPLRWLDMRNWFHPDLVAASDAVIGKVGYSTLAEVHRAGVPFGYVGRPGFRESAPLERFIAERMPGAPVGEAALREGRIAGEIAALLRMGRVQRAAPEVDGAERVAGVIAGLV